jgi:hypothetical protein
VNRTSAYKKGSVRKEASTVRTATAIKEYYTLPNSENRNATDARKHTWGGSASSTRIHLPLSRNKRNTWAQSNYSQGHLTTLRGVVAELQMHMTNA